MPIFAVQPVSGRGRDTIFALSTGVGRAAVAIIRVSGPQTRFVIETMLGRPLEARRATVRAVRSLDGEVVDQALTLWFPSPQSVTGEDVLELHLHGSRAVVARVLAELGGLKGCRPAERGEFTRRGFENGRIDLTQVEALADLIDAETDLQRRRALEGLAGAVSRVAGDWRDRLVGLLARIDASIEFEDEEDVARLDANAVLAEAGQLAGEMEQVVARSGSAEILREGFTVALAAAPNAGKSSLLNAIAGRDVAIVTDLPGTTRDVLEVMLDLAGYPVRLVDTAGLRSATDLAELEGVKRARRAHRDADLVVWLNPVDQPFPAPDPTMLEVRSKVDLGQAGSSDGFAVSAVTGAGIDLLVEELRRRAAEALGVGTDGVLMLRERQRQAILAASAALWQAGQEHERLELASVGVREAADRLAGLIGLIDVETVLDDVFARFCIGK